MAWSVYDPQSAPALMKSLLSISRTRAFWTLTTFTMIPLVLLGSVFMKVLTAREQRRLQAADPWLQE